MQRKLHVIQQMRYQNRFVYILINATCKKTHAALLLILGCYSQADCRCHIYMPKWNHRFSQKAPVLPVIFPVACVCSQGLCVAALSLSVNLSSETKTNDKIITFPEFQSPLHWAWRRLLNIQGLQIM